MVRIAGLVGIRFKLYENDNLLSEHYIERVVTDKDPEYSGSNIAFIEQAMKRSLADSLREVTMAYIKLLEAEIGQSHDA